MDDLTWFDQRPTHSQQHPRYAKARADVDKAWAEYSAYIDLPHPDMDEVNRLMQVAVDLEAVKRQVYLDVNEVQYGEECQCVSPEQSCPTCQAQARLTYGG